MATASQENRIQPSVLKSLAASRFNEKLIQLRLETDWFIIECWAQAETPQGWSRLKDKNGNRLKLELFNTQWNRYVGIAGPLDSQQSMKIIMINDFCKLMMADKNPRYSLVENKCRLIQGYWKHSRNIDNAFKRAIRINKEYKNMIQHLLGQINKNRDATKNEVPEILLRFPLMHILKCRQMHRNITVHQEDVKTLQLAATL